MRRWGYWAVMGVGLLWMLVQWLQPLPTWVSGEVVVRGVVMGLPKYGDTHDTFDFLTDQHQHVRLTWYGPRPLLQPGTAWEMTVRLKPEDGSLYQSRLHRQGVQGVGTVEPLKPWHRQFALDRLDVLNTVRFWLRRRLLFAANALDMPNVGSLFLALGIGDTSQLTGKMWRILQDTGTAHLVAISGLHIGLIGALCYGLVRRSWALSWRLSHRWTAQQAAAVAGFLGALAYGLISGLGIPAQRTLIMLGVAAFYQARGRSPGSFQGWCLALVWCLAIQPWGWASFSLWLSFLAVLSLIFLLSHRVRPARGIRAHLRLQFALSWLLFPITLYCFGLISWVAFGVNLWAIPLVSVGVVPVLLLGMVGGEIPGGVSAGVSMVCFYLAGKGASLWWFGLTQFSDWAYAATYLNKPSLWAFLLAELGMFWALAPRGIPGRWLGMLCVLPMGLESLA